MIITLTSTENKRNNQNNKTTLDLGECENLLRNFYYITIDTSIYIKKIDIF